MSLLTQEQAQELVTTALPEIKEAFRASIRERATRELESVFSEVVKREISLFVETHVVPEVQKSLLENKEGLLNAAAKGAVESSKILTESIVDIVSQNLKSSYKRRDILKLLLT